MLLLQNSFPRLHVFLNSYLKIDNDLLIISYFLTLGKPFQKIQILILYPLYQTSKH